MKAHKTETNLDILVEGENPDTGESFVFSGGVGVGVNLVGVGNGNIVTFE